MVDKAIEYYAALALFQRTNDKENFDMERYARSLIPDNISAMLIASRAYTLKMYPYLPDSVNSSMNYQQLAVEFAESMETALRNGLLLFNNGRPTRAGLVLIRQLLLEKGDWERRYTTVLEFLKNASKKRDSDLVKNYNIWMEQFLKGVKDEPGLKELRNKIKRELEAAATTPKTPKTPKVPKTPKTPDGTNPAPPKEPTPPKGPTPPKEPAPPKKAPGPNTGTSSTLPSARLDMSTGILHIETTRYQLDINKLKKVLEGKERTAYEKCVGKMATNITVAEAIQKLCTKVNNSDKQYKQLEGVISALHKVFKNSGGKIEDNTETGPAFAQKMILLGAQDKKGEDVVSVWNNPAKYRSVANRLPKSDPIGDMAKNNSFSVNSIVKSGWREL